MKKLSLIFLAFLLYSPAFTQKEVILENLGPAVNSKYDEVNPLISPDGKTLYFIRTDHPSNTFGTEGSQDIWFSKYRKFDSSWSKAKRMEHPFNKRRYNAVCGISTDGNTLIIKGAYRKGKYRGRGLSQIRKTKSGWTTPEQLRIKNYENISVGVYDGAFLCNDGNTILLNLSETPGDHTCDLYVTFRQDDDTWSEPINLGNTINTFGLEASPFLAADGVTLYFASDRPDSQGNTDIYVSKRLDDSWTNWTEPQNLGPAINSENREIHYTIAASNDYAFMVSSPGEFGKSDLVRIRTAEKQKPDPVALVFGKVVNSVTGEPIEAAIHYEALGKVKKKGSGQSDPANGDYKIILPRGHIYGFSADAEGFLPISENLDLRQLNGYQEIEKDLRLTPLKTGQTVRMNNIFFESGKSELKPESYPELDRLANLMKKRSSMTIEIGGHTDSTGNAAMNLQLSQNRADAVRNYLLKKGIQEKRVKAVGYGDKKPIASNKSDEGRAQNRRVEFIILQD